MGKKFNDIKREVGPIDLPPEEGRGEGLGLGELRAAVGMTQVELARAMAVDQARVSRFERQDDMFLSTLRDYVAGLGGQLEMLARFPDDRVIWLEPPDVAGAPVATGDSNLRVLDSEGRSIPAPRVLNDTGLRGKVPEKVRPDRD